MKVAVTGATGFIGARLVKALVASGHSVIGFHRGEHPSRAGVEWRRVADLADDRPDLTGVDVVFHLAGRAHRTGVDAHLDEPEFHRVNVDATRIVADEAKRAGVARVVFASSVAVYGSHPQGPVDESTSPVPDTPYGRTKLQAEETLSAVLADSSTDWVTLRPALVYGPGNPGNMARLLALVRRGLPLPFGSIDNRRSMVFVDDLVAALTTVATHPDVSRQVFVISDGDPVSTPRLARELAAVAGRPARLVRVPVPVLAALGRLGDLVERITRRSLPIDSYSVDRLTSDFVVDPERLQRVAGWSPRVPLSEGVRRTVEGS